MDEAQTIRNIAIQHAKELALAGTDSTLTNSIITEAAKIAAFISDATVPQP